MLGIIQYYLGILATTPAPTPTPTERAGLARSSSEPATQTYNVRTSRNGLIPAVTRASSDAMVIKRTVQVLTRDGLVGGTSQRGIRPIVVQDEVEQEILTGQEITSVVTPSNQNVLVTRRTTQSQTHPVRTIDNALVPPVTRIPRN